MAKLDWSKGGNYEPDPARVQRTVDFTVPDKLDKKVTFVRRAGPSPAQQARREKKAKQRATAQAKQMAKRAAKEAKAAKDAAQRTAWEAERAERRKAALARIAADEARKQSPEYIEAQRAEEARLAWIEHERKLELAADREPLRQRWEATAGSIEPLNTSMLTPISLADCPGLIDLMLTGDEHRASFGFNGVGVSVERIGDAAYFEAACSEFGFLAVYPGWYAGEHGAPAHVVLAGDPIACTRWLPMERNDRLAIINCLPLSAIDQTLCRAVA